METKNTINVELPKLTKYREVKEVKATEMTLSEYRKLRNLEVNDSDIDVYGYMVQYSDDYISWCPKEQFEATNRVCETPLDRVIIEKDELEVKFKALSKFHNTSIYSSLDPVVQNLLTRQCEIMCEYINCLNKRMKYM